MLELKKIEKSYTTGTFTQHALKKISLKFRKNEFVAILGPSGSGKTTLLNIIGGLDRYDGGDLIINNKSTKDLKDKDWDAYRNNCIGFIFQSYNLITHIDVLSNVAMGMTLSGISSKKSHQKAMEVLKKVGLKDHAHKKPNQLSGGQMQRVAIARALTNNPDIILADEPTGALDSKTSVQIMELIKEIAKDKLVIMVTHNPELAKKYATRIIEMKDGEIISDNNPIEEKQLINTEYKLRRTSMNLKTALKLSLNNIKTKKGRTFLTSFASSIGVIGIALILSLSNGFDNQINQFEQNTLSSLPVIISKQSMDLSEEQMEELEKDMTNKEGTYPNFSYVIPKKSQEEMVTHQNDITEEYIDYIEKSDSSKISGISYTYTTSLNLLNKIDSKVKQINTKEVTFASLPKKTDLNSPSVISEKYDILAGKEATKRDEIILVVDSKNQVNERIIQALGLDAKKENISFDDILNSTMKLVFNDEYYKTFGNYFTINNDLEKLYQNEKTLNLKVVGIIRLKEEFPSYIQNSYLGYTNELLDYIMEKNNNSAIVKKQKEVNYNVLTGEKMDLSTSAGKEAKENILGYLGAKTTPYLIQIFPKDFESKEYLTNYLDEFNKGKDIEKQIVYTDQAEIMSSLSNNIMDAITIVLVAFSSISLIVSSVMIGIIMYISVLERTKEIGILRSLGARKKDIARVFNSETLIIGIFSGLLGIIIARLLLFPVNNLLYNLTDLKNIAIMNPIHALLLVTISTILTLIGGWIPAKIASKKDPVEALRTE